MAEDTRTECDSMGDIEVPADAMYGAQTQRAVDNFQLSPRRMPASFIRRLAQVKAAAAAANRTLELLSADRAAAIIAAADAIAAGRHGDQFPVDVFQTGSGTSTNMNMNEVLAHLAGDDVHPNDHVNMSQSSNDVIPTTLQISAALELEEALLPALQEAVNAFRAKSRNVETVVKTGRTHLMDAMPVTLAQEIDTWAYQLQEGGSRISDLLPRLKALPLGGTAVGTGVNCPPEFPVLAIEDISRRCDSVFTPAENRFSRMAAQEVSLECSAVLKSVAVTLMKVANDLRWMGSGPLSGLAEIELKALQPGSSIMPGKVNPVVPEAVAMIAADVIGNDASVTVAAQSGNFQLNVMLPLIAEKLLTGIDLLANGCLAIADTVRDFSVNENNISRSLGKNPILVTALNQEIGYEAAAAIAKKAYSEGRDVIDVAVEETDLPRDQLEALMDPKRLAHPNSS